MAIPNAINVFDKVNGGIGRAHFVKHDIYAFSPCQFGCGYEIGVTGYDDDLIDLTFESQGSNVKSKAHINTFLDRVDLEIIVCGNELFRRFDEAICCRWG